MVVEDVLGVVVMVVVDVEDCYLFGVLVEEGLGGDGGIVEEVIVVYVVGCGVVVWWVIE